MTNSFQVNYTDYILSNTPYAKQTSANLAWLGELLEPVGRLNTLKFDNYYYGTTYSFYSASQTYNIGDRIDGNLTYRNMVFECITASTTGTFSIDKWSNILPSFIGYTDRIKYVDSRVVFEYALNTYFRTTFVQPNFDDTAKSAIYIGDNAPTVAVFVIGPDDYTSSFISVDDSTSYGSLTPQVWMGPDPAIYGGTNETFTIYITATAYAGLPGYNPGISFSADNVIRNFADTLNYSGFPYRIEQY